MECEIIATRIDCEYKRYIKNGRTFEQEASIMGIRSLKGHLLIAAPSLADPNFRRTVVLMIQHDENGAFGLVLNRPASVSIQNVWQQVSESPCEIEGTLYQGGPVEGPLMAMHSNAALSEIEVIPGVYFCVGADSMRTLVAAKDETGRFFIGHAGWGVDQLENELAEGAWYTHPAESEDVFGDETELWNRALKASGRARLESSLDLKDIPDDPSMN